MDDKINVGANTLKILRNLIIGDTNDCQPIAFQKSRTRRILFGVLFFIVL